MRASRLIFATVTAIVFAAFPAVGIAQTPTETLTAAAKLRENGDHAAAIEKINEAFKSSKMDSAASSKAFLMRAESYEKLGKTALALADYTNAVYMQGLSVTERPRAVDGRKRTLASLGMTGNDGGAKPLGAAEPAEVAEAKPSSGGFFGGLFGGSSTSADAKPEAAAPAPNTWSQGTRVTAAPAASPSPASSAPTVGAPAATAAAQPARAATPQVAPAATPARQAAVADDGKQYNILLASMSSEDEARGEVKRVGSSLSASLEGKALQVVRYEKAGAVFFRVIAGPYDGAARSKDICESVKAKKVSCLVISR